MENQNNGKINVILIIVLLMSVKITLFDYRNGKKNDATNHKFDSVLIELSPNHKNKIADGARSQALIMGGDTLNLIYSDSLNMFLEIYRK